MTHSPGASPARGRAARPREDEHVPRLAAGGTVIVTENDSNGSKITAQTPEERQSAAGNGSVEEWCRPGLSAPPGRGG